MDPALIDLTPLVDLVFQVVSVIVLALVGWAVQRFAKRYGLKVDESQRAVIDDVLFRAITFARGQIPADRLKVGIDSQFAHAAADYVARSVPDALKHFGIDPTTEAGRGKIREMVLARLPADEPAPAALQGTYVGAMTNPGATL